MTCPVSTACSDAKAGRSNGNNNAFAMANLDVDGDSFPTFNSSSSDVILPPGARCSGPVCTGAPGWRAAPAVSPAPATGARCCSACRGPAATETIASDATFGPTAGDQAYQEFAEVTDLVQRSGTYWGANVVAGTGKDRYAGWSLVIVYRDPTCRCAT